MKYLIYLVVVLCLIVLGLVFFSRVYRMPAPDKPEEEIVRMPAPDKPEVKPVPSRMPAPDKPRMPAPDKPEEEMPAPDEPKG